MAESESQGWRLPPLGGWAKRVYEGVWLALLAGAIVATGLSVMASEWDGPYRIPLLKLGINYTRDAAHAIVVVDVSSAEARAAGVDPGDRVTAINGGDTGAEGLESLIDTAEGDTATLTLAEPSQAPRDVTLAVSSRHVDDALHAAGFSSRFMAGWTLGVLLVANLLGMAASLLLFRRRDNPVAALLALLPLLGAATDYNVLPIAAVYAAITVGQVLLPMALLAFPDGRFAGRLARLLLLANAGWAIVAVFDPDLHTRGALVLLAASGLAVMLRIRKSPALDERQQLRWAALGFGGTALFAVASLAALQLQYLRDDLFYVIANDMAGDLFDLGYTICLWGGLIVALLRYRLYDADVAITRSAVWAIAAPVLAFVFAATIEVLKVALGPVLGNDMVVVPSAGALTAMLIAPVGGWIERRVELWSRRDLIALSRELPAAASDLSENDDAGLLLDHACRAVARTMRARATAILVRDGDRWRVGAAFGDGSDAVGAWLAEATLWESGDTVAVERGDPRFPVRAPLIARPAGEPVAIAWLLVGPRPDGSIQDRDARAVLAEIAPALGRALHVIAARQRRFAALIGDIAAERRSDGAVPATPGRLKERQT